MTLRIAIAAGGTGGHFYPGVAVLEALAARADVRPLFVGTPRGIEARAVPAMGHPLLLLDVSPLNGVRGAALARSLAKLPAAAGGALRGLRAFRPDVLLSVGGYASGPATALAAAMRVPTAVVEPNAVPGMTNRLVGRVATRAFVTYPETARYFREGATRVVGTPVRRAFLERAARAAKRADGGPAHVLVVGGSQGSQKLNEVLPRAVALLRARGVGFTVTHQAGAGRAEGVEREYARLGQGDVEVRAFIDDVAGAMARADVLVCRAGAGTVAELGVIGRPAVFVPLPTAADDHQRRNAEAIAARGAGVCLPQDRFSAETLCETLGALLADRDALAAMGERARALGAPDAADRIADEVLALV